MKLNSGSLIVRFFQGPERADAPNHGLPGGRFYEHRRVLGQRWQYLYSATRAPELRQCGGAGRCAGSCPTPLRQPTPRHAYSSQSGDNNSNSYLPGATMASNYPKLECLSTLTNLGVLCVAPANANALQVKQQITVPILFGGLFGGKSTTTLTATATASARGTGATVAPYNVAIIVDGTGSMGNTDSDSNCSSTRMTCALQGVRVLIQALSPCNVGSTSCGTVTAGTYGSGNVVGSVDRVALFGFPNVSTSNVSYDYATAAAATPHTEPYTFPTAGATSYTVLNSSTYEVVGFSSDYKTSDTATTLNPTPRQSQLRKQLGKGRVEA